MSFTPVPQFNEDTAHTSGDVMVPILGVRRDADTSLVGTDGDYAPFQLDANGRIKAIVVQSGNWSVRNQDGAGNSLESATSAPSGTERGLIVRNIPSGTQTITGTIGLSAGTNNIGDVDVLSLPALPTGTNVIGNVVVRGGAKGSTTEAVVTSTNASSDRQLLDVILRDTSGNALSVGGGTQYAVDTALGSTPTGTLMLAKRDDALSALTPVEGDAVELRVDANGALFVNNAYRLDNVNDSITAYRVDTLIIAQNLAMSSTSNNVNISSLVGVSDVAVQITGTWTGTVTFEGSVDNGTTYFATPVAAVGTAGTLVTTATANGAWKGDVTGYSHFRVRCSTTGTGTAVVSIRASYGTASVFLSRGLPAGANVIGAVTQSGTWNVGAINTSITPGTAATNLGKARDAAAGATDTNIGVMMVRRDTPTAVTPIAGDYEIPQISANGEQWVRLAGELADDAAATLGTTRVVPIGAVAVETDGTDPASVSAEGDASLLRSDRNRILLVNQTHPRWFNVSADYATAQTNTVVQAAPGAGLRLYITDIVVSNGATAGNITLLDGSGGTVRLELYVGVNGGMAKEYRTPIILTANTALCITSTTVTTHSVSITGYTAP